MLAITLHFKSEINMVNFKYLIRTIRLLTFVILICLIILMVFNTRHISSFVNNFVSLQTINIEHISEVDRLTVSGILKEYLIQNDKVDSILLYKFVPDEHTKLYKGQIILGSEKRINNSVISLIGGNFVPKMSEYNKMYQEILLNKVSFGTTETLQLQCDEYFDYENKYICASYQLSYASVNSYIAIPIYSKNNYQVVGYVIVFMKNYKHEIDIAHIVNKSKPFVKKLLPVLENGAQ